MVAPIELSPERLEGRLVSSVPSRPNAGGPMIRFYLSEFRHNLRAVVNSHRAPGVEHAATGRVQRTGYLSGQYDALSLGVDDRVGYGHCRQEGLGVGMQRIAVDFVPVGNFHHLAQIHHRYPVANVAHHR